VVAPTSDDIRGWSKIDFAEFGYPDDTPDPLDEIVLRSNAYQVQITGRPLDGTMPDNLAPLARMASQGIVETLVIRADEGNVDTGADFILLASMAVGGYSETRRQPVESLGRGMAVRQLPPGNPLLDGVLWILMTSDMRAYWQAWVTGVYEAFFQVEEVNWSPGPFPTWYTAATGGIGITYDYEQWDPPWN
jgi:hypothetical protein